MEAVENNTKGSVTSNSNEAVSPEDEAWADSCLIGDLELSETQWSSMKDALLEILSSAHETLGSSAAEHDIDSGEMDYMVIHYGEKTENVQLPEGAGYDLVLINKEEDGTRNEIPAEVETDAPQTYMNNPFRPNYKDELIVTESTPLTPEFELPENELDSSSEDIFKVWDLDIPAEEDVFQEKLKAFENSSLELPSSTLDNTGPPINNEPLHKLISGLADLSLGPEPC